MSRSFTRGLRRHRLSTLSMWLVVFGSIPVGRLEAQAPKGLELYVGGGFANSRYFDRANSPGWIFRMGFRQNERLGWTAEFAGQYEGAGEIEYNGADATFRQYQFMFGPQAVFRNTTVRPFVYGLAGVAARHLTVPSDDPLHPQDVLAVDFGVATSLGAGMDWRLRDWLGLRLFQGDYLATRLAPVDPDLSPVGGQLPPTGRWQHHFRLSGGFVFNF